MQLSVGIIGTGVMGSEHARILREDTPGAVLVAAFDADAERAQFVVGAEGKVFEDAIELIRSDKVQAVVISSPDATHAALTLECIAQGKPVLCEKPLGGTAEEARSIVDAEVAVGRKFVQIGFMRRFDPGYLELARRHREKELGSALIMHNIHRNAVAPDWYTAEMSISNAFVHEIDVARWMLGTEMTELQVHRSGKVDPLMIHMTSTDGVMISTEIFMNCSFGYQVGTQLVGSRGAAETVDPVLTRIHSNGALRTDHPQIWIPRFRQSYRDQMHAWVQSALTGNANDGANTWDAYMNCVIAECAIQTLREEGRIELPSPDVPELYAKKD